MKSLNGEIRSLNVEERSLFLFPTGLDTYPIPNKITIKDAALISQEVVLSI